MGSSYSTGNNTITGAVATGYPIPAVNQTPVTAFLTKAGAGLETVYTVPADHTFYLMGWGCRMSASNNRIYEADGTTEIGETATNATVGYSWISFSFPAAIYTAGQTVKMIGPGAGMSCMIAGYLLDD